MDNKRQKQYHQVYMNIASEISSLSQAVRSKVGCIIVKNGSIISFGFNGTPTGFDNCCEVKNTDGSLTTKHEVLHAESNAIAKLAKSSMSSENADMYVTMSPCFDCAKLIIQAGIKRLFYKEKYRNTEGLDLLKKGKVKVVHLKLL